MSSDPRKPDRTVATVRIMAAVSVALAVMCAWLAYAWQAERQVAACWRTASEFQYHPDGDCRG